MRIGFLASRLAGVDGVSLETAKWITVLQRMGHTCFTCAGDLDPQGPPGQLVPEMHPDHPMVADLQRAALGGVDLLPDLNRDIDRKALGFEGQIEAFIEHFEIDLLVVANAASLPLNIPLGVALANTLRTTGIPAILHHHAFYWEHERFLVNRVPAYLRCAFPPDLPTVRHVVISTIMQRELYARSGIHATYIPYVADFDNPPGPPDDYANGFRADLGLAADDVIVLQPTRLIAHKSIERGIELVRLLNDPRYKFVVTGQDSGEISPYFEWLLDQAVRARVETLFIGERIEAERGQNAEGQRVYTLPDVYPNADLVTYPSHYEGFGSTVIEALYFKRPLVVNRYPAYRADIAPLGVQAIEFDEIVTDGTAVAVLDLLADPERIRRMTEDNYEIGLRHFSYAVLEHRLNRLLESIEDRRVEPIAES